MRLIEHMEDSPEERKRESEISAFMESGGRMAELERVSPSLQYDRESYARTARKMGLKKVLEFHQSKGRVIVFREDVE